MQITGEQIAHMQHDVIDTMLGPDRAANVAPLRERRGMARINAQQSYDALFGIAPLATVRFSVDERFALALFISHLHRQDDASRFYRAALEAAQAALGARPESNRCATADTDFARLVCALGDDAACQGPYGNFPPGALSIEDRPGPVWAVDGRRRAQLGARLAAAFDHAHLLVYHPRDASASALQSLLDSGWSSDDVIVLSQMVAFLTFQIRIVHGLSVLAAMRTDTVCAEALA
ncbi:CMD domain protein [Robbsia sp. KACC 23696]|uniref:CMD domain protein n=1 Tax=Robbsia sp. KACC 23696 TaxID=3149231 RepID=UPI00325BBBAE